MSATYIPVPVSPSSQPLQQSDILPRYPSVSAVLNTYDGDDHLYVLYPEKIAAAAQTFLTGFPGKILYAVKANPHSAVLQTLWRGGIRNFDVASLREINLVRAELPNARLYVMHTVKSRGLIRTAYAAGVRDFAVDCSAEWDKICQETNNATDLNLHIRLTLPHSDAVMPLDGKFGASFEEAVHLLKSTRGLAQSLGLSFHVGSQCLSVKAYDKAIAYTKKVVTTANVAIDTIDVGGGFPVAYPGMTVAPLTDYFTAIHASISRHGFSGLEILGEPGRALCAEGGSSLVRVELRKGNDLYLNDGTYGSLFDAGQFAWKFPMTLHRQRPPSPSDNTEGFRLFGPTCDSCDEMVGPFDLPADTQEGDWIEVQHLGAYGQSLAARFNGFYSETVVLIQS